jgi:adenosylcobinamide-phosphate synthase
MVQAISLLVGWILDRIFGDPSCIPHPIVGFGKAIAWCEHHFNHDSHRKIKGGVVAVCLILATYLLIWGILDLLLFMMQGINLSGSLMTEIPTVIVQSILIFYCLAGTTLIKEVSLVFIKLDQSLDEGRKQVARIVGRDTSKLSAQEVRMAALETLAENLSDGVIAPLFWLSLLGVPGMMTYKMINTLDSMIAYRTARYKDFGCIAAHIDDAANWFPARITAFLMVIASLFLRLRHTLPMHHRHLVKRIYKNASRHLSPNSGWPEAALAMILDCKFGGAHQYFGETINKPFIGDNPRSLTTDDMRLSILINRIAEDLAILCILLIYII